MGDPATELMHTLLRWAAALGLAGARPVALVTVMPVFTRLGLSGLVRNGVALALALPAVPAVLAELSSPTVPPTGALLIVAAKEVTVGVLLGLLLGIPFWAAEAAGDVADLQRGSSAGYLIDPSAQGQSSVTGTLFVLVLVTLFFAAGGLPLLAEALYRSWELWPPLAPLPAFAPETPALLLGLLDGLLRAGLAIAAPLVLTALLGDLLLGLIARFAPQLNVFDLSMSVKSAAFVLVLPLYVWFLVRHLAGTLPEPGATLDLLRRMLP